jgi:hypothetical protein
VLVSSGIRIEERRDAIENVQVFKIRSSPGRIIEYPNVIHRRNRPSQSSIDRTEEQSRGNGQPVILKLRDGVADASGFYIRHPRCKSCDSNVGQSAVEN